MKSATELMPDSQQPETRTSALRWLMILLVFAATTINYLDRQTLSVIAPVLHREFHMSNEAYSRIVFAFMLAYTVMNSICGPIIDRLGTKKGYALTVAWWSAAEMLHSLSHGPLSMGIYRFLLGFGEAGNWPAGVKVVAEWFPPKERALGSGIFNSGSSIGAVIAAPLVAWIVLQFGWRPAFASIGALGFLWVALWLVVYRVPEENSIEKADPPMPVRQILSSRFLWQFTLSKVFSDPVWYFYSFWFPQYLKTGRGFDMRAIGELAWIPFFTAGIGNLLGGLLARYVLRSSAHPRRTRKLIIVGFSLLMTAGMPAGLVHTATQSIGLVSLATLGYTGALANLLALPGDVYPKSTVASVWGFASTGAGFGGMVFSLLTGWMVDRWSFTPVFVLFGVIPILSALLIWRLPNRDRVGWQPPKPS